MCMCLQVETELGLAVSFVERPGDSTPSPPALSMQEGIFFFVVDGGGFRDFFSGVYGWDKKGVPCWHEEFVLAQMGEGMEQKLIEWY